MKALQVTNEIQVANEMPWLESYTQKQTDTWNVGGYIGSPWLP